MTDKIDIFNKERLERENLEKTKRSEFNKGLKILIQKETDRRTAFEASHNTNVINEEKRRANWLTKHNIFIEKEKYRRANIEKIKEEQNNSEHITIEHECKCAPTQDKEWQWPSDMDLE